MKDCEGCGNMLSEEAEMCYVCYARVGEGIPRPGAKPINTSYDWLIIGGILILLVPVALIMSRIFDINGDFMQAVGYITGGISLVSLIMKLFNQKSK